MADGAPDRSDVEVHVDAHGTTHRAGLLRRHATRRGRSVTFERTASAFEHDDLDAASALG